MAEASDPARPVKFRHLLLALVFGAGAAGVVLWQRGRLEEKRRIARLEAQVRDLGTRLERVKASTYVAEVEAVSSRIDPESGRTLWRIRFVEFDRERRAADPPREFEVRGEEVYFDALVVEFDEKFVEQGDGLRGKSLHLFRRAFGDRENPADGVPLWSASGDEIPPIYRPTTLAPTPEALEFERGIWRRFWALVDDPGAQERAGVRFAYGDAKSIRPRVGQTFRLTLRHAGGLAIEPLPPAPSPAAVPR